VVSSIIPRTLGCQTLLELLRRYWKVQRPKNYLFLGSHPLTHVQPGTVQEICWDALLKRLVHCAFSSPGGPKHFH
jgi:hypothetical protein